MARGRKKKVAVVEVSKEQKRLEELEYTIKQFIGDNKVIPSEWVTEYRLLQKMVSNGNI